MAIITLPTLRYSSLYQILIMIDMIVVLTLWITGAFLQFHTTEIDQIIKFNFTESIFDIILIASIKAAILFITVSELEVYTVRISLKVKLAHQPASSLINSTTNTSTNDDEVLIQNVDQIVQISGNINHSDSQSHADPDLIHYKRIKTFLHYVLLVLNLASTVYITVKFSFVLSDMLHGQDENNLKQPMDYFFFSVLIFEFAFSLIQFVFSVLSWTFMRRLARLVVILKTKIDQENTNETNTGEKQTKKKKVNLKRLIGLSYPERYMITTGFLMLLISSSTNVIVPYFFGAVVDSAQNFPDLNEMNKYIGYMFIVFLLGSLAGAVRSWIFELAGQRVVARLRQNVFKAIIKQDVKFFDENRTGELTSRISSDTQVLQSAVTSNLSMLSRYLLQIIGSVVFMFSLQASLTGLLLGVIPVVTLLTMHYGKYLGRLRKKFQEALASSNVISEESISSLRTVRSFSAEKKVSNVYEENISKSLLIGRKLAIAQGGFMCFVGIISAGALALILWYGGKLVHDKKISTGVLASFLMYTLQVAMAFAFISSLYGDFMQALGASERIFEIMDTVPKININDGFKPSNDTEEDESFDGSLTLDAVSFSYPTRAETKVLKEISLEIEKGKTLALVGPSGGGKSTIFSLLERFYDPDEGEILVGPRKMNLKSFNLSWIHSKIAMVSQEPVLFGGSIKENISFGMEQEVDLERIIQVAKLANAHDFIMTFEKGYDTLVGERGIRLSGGQKQRIAIARALLVNPKLLLLDEATSALDSESEHLVQEAIDRAMKGRTVCVIAHRLSTVKDADKVVVLDQGKLVEQGTHQELCELDGIYKRLVLRQLLTKESTTLQTE